MGEFSRKGALIGYSTIAVLAIAPMAVLETIDAPVKDIGTPPFVVFTASIAVILVVLRPIWLVVRLHPRPTRQLISDLRRYSPWLLSCLFVMFAVTQTMQGVSNIKNTIPFTNPFWADPVLIQFDRALFFGFDAWQLTHAIIPPKGTLVIDWIYAAWQLVQLAFCMTMALLFDRRLQLQAVLSFQVSWLFIGNLIATAMSSVGPIFVANFWSRNDFLPIVERLHAEGATYAIQTVNYLLETQATNALGSGISAMPSMHVGIAVLVALFFRQRLAKFQGIAWVFVVLTYVGSIHLGWHYATDGIVSAFFVVIIWKAMRSYVAWLAGISRPNSDVQLAASPN